MEICYIEAGVLERMLARAENLSARVDRLYERNRCKEPGESAGYAARCQGAGRHPGRPVTLRGPYSGFSHTL